MDFNDKALILTLIITYTKLCNLFTIERGKSVFMGGGSEERRDPWKIWYFPLKFSVNIKLLKKVYFLN